MLTRRHFFGRSAAGLGTIALASLCDRELEAARRKRRAAAKRGRHRRISEFRAAGQAGDLSVSVGRSIADGPVRSQARARADAGHRLARLDPDGATADRHDLAAGPLSGGGQPVQVRAPRPERRGDFRTVAAHGQGCRRALLHQLDAHRGDQPRPGRHLFSDGGSACRAAEHRRRGCHTAWGAKTTTCPRSWS